MSKLIDLVRYESANSTLAFRKRPYGAKDREKLLVDMLALANARVAGPRFLVLGVNDEVGGKRQLKGVSKSALANMIASYQQAVDDCIEPTLSISMRSLEIKDRTLAVIVLRECEQQPYVLRRDVSERLRKGDGWIRRGAHQTRLGRADLKSMFSSQTLAGVMGCEVQVIFDGAALSPSLSLPVLPLTKRPSELARARIHGLLEAKKAAHERLGKTDTWMDRLAYARLHGADQPYETQTPMSLLAQLGKTEQENAAADEYYEHELRAHMINLLAINIGDGPLRRASVLVEIPEVPGVAVAGRIYPPVGKTADEVPAGYPKVESHKGQTRILAQLGPVDPGARVPVFVQPLRLMLREPAAGIKLPIKYTLSGTELREPITGSLTVTITESREHPKAVCSQP